MTGRLRIAVGGFMHETNTFVPRPTTFEDFRQENQWPGLRQGHREAMLAAVRGRNLGIAGFSEVAGAAGHELMPLAWTMAQPGGRVADDAFEKIAAMIVEPLAGLKPDVVFVELHGAMASETHDDAEGELLAQVRAAIGPDVPLVSTLDLHANVSARMVELATYMTAFREYPHTDWGETGRRAARALPDILRRGPRRAAFLARLDMLLPITAQSTYMEPARGLYAALAALEEETGVALSYCMGFPPADIADCGPTVIGYGADAGEVRAAVEGFAERVRAAEPAFAQHKVLSGPEAVARAIALAKGARRPVVIADTEDNAGAGSSSSTTGMLAELVRQQAKKAISAVHHEPAIALAAHAAGAGAAIEATFGVAVEGPGQEPFAGRFEVLAVSDGRFAGTGPMLGGAMVDFGTTALLAHTDSGVMALVASHRQQPLSRNTFGHIGVDPARLAIIVLKSSVHFRNDFQDFAEEVLVASSPGANPADPARLAYQRLPSHMRRSLRTPL